ncbi:MAG: protein-glutamate O-methyltransferase CheR [Nitrospinae bacterium]|nr:protein-glutamate O-methyltransferase CheR [Nitrospinota bacterium]
MSGPREIIQRLVDDRTGTVLVELIDALSTNVTHFFREDHHFKFMREKLLPDLVKRKKASGDATIRIWSAACSTGTEPYTIAIVVKEFFDSFLGWDFKILATDISTKVLGIGAKGIYSTKDLETVPKTYLTRYFRKIGGRHEEGGYQVNPELRNLVTFRRFNLLTQDYPFTRKFDLIFCRNVMIYFDQPTKNQILQSMQKHLHASGYLFTGHAESLGRAVKGFKHVEPAIYIKV